MRHFENKFSEYAVGQDVTIEPNYWSQVISSTCQTVIDNTPNTLKASDGGLYVGNAGTAYMLHYLAQSEKDHDRKCQYLHKASEYIEVSLTHFGRSHQDPPNSFLLGAAGVYAVGAAVYHSLGDEDRMSVFVKKYIDLSQMCVPVSFLKCGSDELFVGRAGYLCGAHWLNKILGQQVIGASILRDVCTSIIRSGQEYAKKNRSPSPLMFAYYETEYLGAAHGVSSIIQMVLGCPDFLEENPAAKKLIRDTVDYYLSVRQPSGNYPPAMDEVQSSCRRPANQELVHWCHGAPGAVYMFAKAFLLWRDDRYLQACADCAAVIWKQGLLKKGPGICHGVAGNGYVFLLLYRLTNDSKYLYQALSFANFMMTEDFKRVSRTPDSPYSLYEGLAGTVCYFKDLLQPEKSQFPFFDIL